MKKLLLLAVAALLYSCATIAYQPYAREVKRKPQVSGVIALKIDNRAEDHQKAEALMQANCGSGAIAKIVDEGEVVTGEKTNTISSKSQEDAPRSAFTLSGIKFGSSQPSENTNTTAITEQMKEWHISYSCVAVKAPSLNVKKKKISKN